MDLGQQLKPVGAFISQWSLEKRSPTSLQPHGFRRVDGVAAATSHSGKPLDQCSTRPRKLELGRPSPTFGGSKPPAEGT